ncbi:SDR family oxidoreductase [Marivirga salinae]|uniref:SDR family oxidoreductase n=1 Tax=Marivirga salinarum TaxID=3059078 RepID=A0AA51RE31_9BACT|nr:SDR family oxidoreductase [Marivirga sp. BDSF4-3]WMN11654.1 SDR family oxidoreductase [Marivirga sp. BDSF4-3]
MMKTLIVGASGTTGKHLVEQFLAARKEVKIIVRPTAKIPEFWHQNELVQIIHGNISEMKVDEMNEIISDCDSFASCLGHNLTFKGIFGKPRKLVADAVQLICDAISKNNPEQAVKFVLMNTVGNQNRDINEPISTAQKIVIALIRLLVPPQADNEKAADFLRIKVDQKDSNIEWVAVRPDALINEKSVTDYSLHPSPIRSAIFNPGETSRINVAHFMAQLILDDDLWNEWKGQMPVIYNE